MPDVIVVEAVLTDLDGVLVDSTKAVEHVWREWAGRVGVDADSLMANLHGVRSQDTVARLVPAPDVDIEVAAIEAAELEHAYDARLVSGADTLVASLPAGRWAVVTSGSRAIATARLDAVGLPRPRVLVTADDVAAGKPDPEGYVAAAGALGFDPSRCLVVEDAPAGIDAGRAAGATVIAVTSSHPREELSAAHLVVADPGRIAVTATRGGLRIDAR